MGKLEKEKREREDFFFNFEVKRKRVNYKKINLLGSLFNVELMS